jgi:hypothetical protein
LEIALRLNLPMKWKTHKVFHISLLELFIQGNRELDLEKVLDAGDVIEADNEYHVEEVIGGDKFYWVSIEKSR